MGKIAVTGSSGFTGRYLVSELQRRGYDVVEIVHRKNNVNQVECNIIDKESVRNALLSIRPNYIIHLAGISFVEHSDQQLLYNVNLFGTLNILEACKELRLPVKKIILSSSANVYGNPNVEKKSEEDLTDPVNHYAMSKLAMEKMAKLSYDDLPIIITRPFNYTGLGQDKKFLIPKIVGHFVRNEKVIELGNINVYRDISDVRDIVKYYCELLKSNFCSGIINLCSGNVYSISDVISEMERIAGYSIIIKENPRLKRRNDILVLSGSNEKLKKEINFEVKFNIKRTLADMYSASK